MWTKVLSALDPDPVWLEAIERAARGLPAGDPWAQVFYEEREDLRVEVGPGLRLAVPTRQSGIQVRWGGPRPRSRFVADPSPSDAGAIVSSAVAHPDAGAADNPTRRRSVPEGPDSEAIAAGLDALRVATEALPGRGELTLTGRWIAFRQRIYVSGRGGAVGTDLRSGAHLSVEIAIRGGDGSLTRAVGDHVLRSHDDREGCESLVEKVARRADERRTARSATPGEKAVVFAPGVGGILIHESVGHGLEADTALRAASALERGGSVVAAGDVTVIDDPRRGRGGWRIDDEGVESRATPLLERGRVAGRLHDLSTAARSGDPPTGHGRRSSFREPVLPRMGCTFLAPGRLDPAEVLAGTAHGIYVRRMESASTDTRSGSALFVVSDADRIDQGRLGPPLESFLLRVDSSRALSSLDCIGHDLAFDSCVGSCLRDAQPVVTSVGAPTFRIGVATVIC